MTIYNSGGEEIPVWHAVVGLVLVCGVAYLVGCDHGYRLELSELRTRLGESWTNGFTAAAFAYGAELQTNVTTVTNVVWRIREKEGGK